MKTENYLLYGIVVLVLILGSLSLPKKSINQQHSETSMALTGFDVELAKKFMDKDNDGRCDFCGMDVDFCIKTGQLQCNMDPKSTIGVLGSKHIHADFKIYINNKVLDEEFFRQLAKMHENAMKNLENRTSSFMHVHEAGLQGEEIGDVLHMHASNVPLWIFFESINGKFNETCLAIDEEIFCNNENKNIRFYVNGKENKEFGDYVFKDLDKMLISYGDINENIQNQIASITDFASGH